MIGSDAVRHPLEPLHPATRRGAAGARTRGGTAGAAVGKIGHQPSGTGENAAASPRRRRFPRGCFGALWAENLLREPKIALLEPQFTLR